VNARGPSFGSSFLTYGGGITALYGLLAAYSTVTGTSFAFGSSNGIPLPSTWLGTAILLIAAAIMLFLGRQWDRPGFAALRSRRKWLVPVVVTFVVFPGLFMLLFMMLQ
jgi:hypothetical protein